MPKSYRFVKCELDNKGVLTVMLNRPPVNAVDQEFYVEIADLFGNVDILGDPTRVVILAAEGRHFCGGNDLDEFATMSPANGTERMWRVREAFFAISSCAVPVIGAVQGSALGTGLAIAASCDFVVAERDARFGLPELTVGVMGGARHLARLAPQPLVRRMYFTGEHMTAEELHSSGGCIFLCEPGELLTEVRRLAVRVAGFSPTAVRVSKHIVDRIETMDLPDGYAFEQRGTVRMSGHKDSKEALTAFRERRPPNYDQQVDRTMFG